MIDYPSFIPTIYEIAGKIIFWVLYRFPGKKINDQNIPKELTAPFFTDKYSMSTGSDEWRDIKGDFELEDDAIIGTVSYEDSNKSIGLDKVNKYKSDLEKFKARVNDYNPKDEVESKEKQIIQNKIKIGLEIYKIILESLT